MAEERQARKAAFPNYALRKEREERGWTQASVAERIGLSDYHTVGKWERGTISPSSYWRKRLCALYEKSEDELGFFTKRALQHKRQQPLPDTSTETPTIMPDPDLSASAMADEQPKEPSVQSSHLLSQQPAQALEQRYRTWLLTYMHSFWIKERLERSLHVQTRLVLGLHSQLDALRNPWEIVMQESERSSYPLPDHQRIVEVYEESAGQLLILGEPGAGKTTMLWELAKELLQRASHDMHHPIPVIFNLSSWAERKPKFATWLSEELQKKYQIPRKTGQAWIAHHQLLPLLDGLDEVAQAQRSACIEAINAYRQEYGLAPMVVCSRKTEYFAQLERLLLQFAVVIQPLKMTQIDEYLALGKEQLEAVRHVLHTDPVLQELVKTPLMLNVLILAYHGVAIDQFPLSGSLDSRRRQIFDTYVQRMMKRRKISPHYTAKQTVNWLSRLAIHMARHNQTEFYLEEMQPSWLLEEGLEQHYQIYLRSLRFMYSLIIGILLGLIVGLLFEIVNRLLGGIAHGLESGLLGGGLYGLILGILGKPPLIIKSRQGAFWSKESVKQSLDQFGGIGVVVGLGVGAGIGITSGPVIGICSGLICGLMTSCTGLLRNSVVVGLACGLVETLLVIWIQGSSFDIQTILHVGLRSGLIIGLLAMGGFWLRNKVSYLAYGLLYGLVFGELYGSVLGGPSGGFIAGMSFGVLSRLAFELLDRLDATIQPAEIFLWSRKKMQQNLGRFLLAALATGVAYALVSEIFTGRFYGFFGAIVSGIVVGIVGGFLSGMTAGVASTRLAKGTRIRPNQGMRRSAYNCCRVGLLSGILFGPLYSIIIGGGPRGIMSTLLCGLLMAIMSGLLIGGGIECVKHALLRLILWHARILPLRYAHFLDYAVEQILLSKVEGGGGYIFVHRLLLDYFKEVESNHTQDDYDKN